MTGLLMILLLLSGVLFAQPDDPPPDTSVVLKQYTDNDTIVTEEVKINPAEEGVKDDGDQTFQEKDKESEYFTRKDPWDIQFDSSQLRKLPDSVMREMHDDEDFWYANAIFEKKKPEKPEDYQPKSDGWQTLLWVFIIIGFLAFLGIYLGNSNIGMFRRTKNISIEDSEHPELDDIFSINYQKEIDKAIAAGNYRLAVRLLFLRTLRQLTDKQVIRYTQDKTNFDYLMQLINTSWYQPFFRLVRNYEYVWYGKFDIDRERFDLIKDEFTNFEHRL